MPQQSLPERHDVTYEELPSSFHRRIENYAENWKWAVTPTAIAFFESIAENYPHLWPEIERKVYGGKRLFLSEHSGV